MLTVSHTVSYALRALAHLEGPDGAFLRVDDLVRLSDTPRPYTAKVLQILQRARILDSARGRTGGFRLTRAPEAIPLTEVVDALEPRALAETCLLGLGPCTGDLSCPVVTCCRDLHARIHADLSRLSLKDLQGVYRNRAGTHN